MVEGKIHQRMLKVVGEGLRQNRVYFQNIFLKYLLVPVVEYVHKFLDTSPSRKETLIFLSVSVAGFRPSSNK